MTCKQCGSEMIKTSVGWMCHNCGYAELDQPGDAPTPLPQISHETVVRPTSVEPPTNLHHPTDLPPSVSSLHGSALASVPAEVPPAAQPTVDPPTAPVPPPPVQPTTPTPPASVPSIDQPNPPASSATVVSGWTDPTAHIKPKRRIPKLVIILGAVVLVIGVLSGSAYGYFWNIQPKAALGNYLAKLATSKTASYNGTISFDEAKTPDTATSIGAAIQKTSVSIAGAYDLNDTNNPKFKMNVKGSFGTESVSGDLLVADKALFFKIGSLGLLNSFGITLSNDWYKISLDQSFNDNACYNKAKGKSGTILGQRLLTTLPTTGTKRLGLMTSVDGHRVSHYRGTIDFSRIQSYIDKANQALPAECKLTYNANDFKDLSLSYDLYAGSNFDRLDINAKDTTTGGGTTHVTLDTSDYNKPVDIKAPSGAKDLKDLLSLFGGDSSATTDTTSSDPVLSRDAQRKSDLRAVKNALETYYNDVTGYPPGTYSTLGKYLVTTYIPSMPADPTAGRSYTYTPSPKGCKADACTQYVLDATLENTNDSQIKAGTTNVFEVTSTN